MRSIWFKGYVRLRIESLCAERFFNLCGNRGIQINRLVPEKEYCYFTTSLPDYYKLKPVVRKTKPHICMVGKAGFPFVLRGILAHPFFLAGIALFIAVMYVLNLFVWNITIDGNYLNSNDEMYNYLMECGITYGTKKSSIDCEALEARIRRDFDDIIWVSVALRGTKLSIDIRENQDEIITKPEGAPSNIVAGMDGVVESIIVRSGTPLVKPGDVVKAGDVLISGTVVTQNEAYEPVGEEQVYADGDVYLFVQLPYTRVLEREYIKKEYTGRSYKSLTFHFGGKLVDFEPYREKYEYEDEFGENWILCPYQDFYLPFGTTTTYHREYILTDTFYTDEELKQLMEDDFSYYLQKLEEKGIQIIENNVTISINENEAQMYGFIYAIEKTDTREAIQFEYN